MSKNKFNSPNAVNAPLHDLVTEPLSEAMAHARSGRVCVALSDPDWVDTLLRRILDVTTSGRCVVQKLADCRNILMSTSTFFESLHSKRRLKYLRELSAFIEKRVNDVCNNADDPYHSISSLKDFSIFAGDSHYIKHASHDELIGGEQFATGDLFGLNLRTHALFHVTKTLRGEKRKKEHDMHALKRIGPDELRHGVPKGKKVIWVWDKAGIDIPFWIKCWQNDGIYFVSRAKDNMNTTDLIPLTYDKNDPQNVGVTAFGLASISNHKVRCVHYRCPVTQTEFTFISTLTTVEPGVIAHLYRSRWDIEKVFDELKRKLHEDKSWASGDVAKNIHSEMRALVHNLLLILERKLATQNGVTNEREDQRREKRIKKDQQTAEANGQTLAPLACALMRRVTQRVRVFIRWVNNCLDSTRPLEELIALLRQHLGKGG